MTTDTRYIRSEIPAYTMETADRRSNYRYFVACLEQRSAKLCVSTADVEGASATARLGQLHHCTILNVEKILAGFASEARCILVGRGFYVRCLNHAVRSPLYLNRSSTCCRKN